MKKYFVLILIIFLALNAITFSKEKKQKQPKIKYPVKVEDTQKFYEDFIGHKVTQKSEYETQEEFEKRIPVCDTSKVFFIISEKFKNKYDIDKKILDISLSTESFSIGHYQSWASINKMAFYKNPKYMPIKIDTKFIDFKDYKGTNSYGASVRISKSEFIDFFMYLSY